MATTSSGTITTSTVNGTSRITGLSSGVDVDSVVKGLMSAERVKLNKLDQQEELLEWKQEAYRNVSTSLQTFSTTYLDSMASTSIIKQSTFLQYEATSSDDNLISASATSNAKAGNHTLTVSQLATAQTLKSSGAAKATSAASYGFSTGDTWSISVDGISYSVDLASVTNLASLQEAIDKATNSGSVALESGKLAVQADSAGKLAMTAADNSILSFTPGAQASLGFDGTAVTANVTKNIQGSAMPSYSFASTDTWKLTVDGAERTVNLSGVTNLSMLQSAVDTAVGAGKLKVSTNTSGYLTVIAADSGVQAIAVAEQSTLGFTSSGVLSNRLTTSETLSELVAKINPSLQFGGTDSDEIAFSINGVNFTFDASDTLTSVMNSINKSDAKVTMSYDTVNDRLALVSNITGAGTTLTATDTEGNFISSLLNCSVAAQDAKLKLDGKELTRSSNTVAVDGVTYTLNKVTSSEVSVGVKQNTESTVSAIVKFVDAYNSLITTVKGKLQEDYDRDYTPLTAEQKSSMSDTEITAWEKKAKVGLLERDSLLDSFLTELREAFLVKVPGTTLTLDALGITSSSYEDYGKLTINESTLRSVIQSDPDGVMTLFTQKSSSYGSTSSARLLSGTEQTTRYNEEGYGMRFYDIFQNYIGTTRDTNGAKGLLVEKAGLANDSSASDNTLSDAMTDLKERITNEEKRLSQVQERYYAEYTNMETYLNTLSAQMSSFSDSSS